MYKTLSRDGTYLLDSGHPETPSGSSGSGRVGYHTVTPSLINSYLASDMEPSHGEHVRPLADDGVSISDPVVTRVARIRGQLDCRVSKVRKIRSWALPPNRNIGSSTVKPVGFGML